MIGLAIGAGALLGIAFFKRARWHRHLAYVHGHGGWGHHHHGHGFGHGFGFGGWRHGRRARLYGAMAALDLSPAQEKLVRTELGALRERMYTLKSEVKQTRADLARSVAGATFDRATLDAAFARHDRELAEVRGAFTGSLERVHASLDDTQRERLAEMIDRGRGWRGPGGPDLGPYRV
jgi:uncharacterized membrane protein